MLQRVGVAKWTAKNEATATHWPLEVRYFSPTHQKPVAEKIYFNRKLKHNLQGVLMDRQPIILIYNESGQGILTLACFSPAASRRGRKRHEMLFVQQRSSDGKHSYYLDVSV